MRLLRTLALLIALPGTALANVPINMEVDVTSPPYNAKGDDSTDNCTAIQAAVDQNQHSIIYFPFKNGSGIYRSSCPIYLTAVGGRAFDGGLGCDGSTIKFTNAGNAADFDAAMQNGFVSYPKTNGAGGDTSGWGDNPRARVEGCKVDGPLHGAGFRLANGIGQELYRTHTSNNRYGALFESSINARIIHASGFASTNAGIAFRYTANSNVYYGSDPLNTFWNDNFFIESYNYADGAANGTLAGILDEGTHAWTARTIKDSACQGKTGQTGLQYCLLTVGTVQPTVINLTAEQVKYPMRNFSSIANEGAGAAIPGVTAAEPSGTLTRGSFADGYCLGGTFIGLHASNGTIAFQPDCNGIVNWIGSSTSGVTTDIKLTQGGGQVNYQGHTRYDNANPVIQFSPYGGFNNIIGAAVSVGSGGGTSPSLNTGANSNAFKLTIGSGGTASTVVLNFAFTAPNGWACNADDMTTPAGNATRQTASTTTSSTFTNYSRTVGTATAWPAGDVLHIGCRPL